MRAAGGVLWVVAIVLGAGCAPGFDQFELARRDAGPVPDGGGRVDGGPVDTGTALGATGGCADVLRSVLMEESFDTGAEFRLRSGSVTLEGGSAVLAGGQEYVLYESLSSFRDVVACATVRVGRTSGVEPNELHLGLRGPMHGVSLNLTGNAGDVKLVSVEPDRNVLVDRQPLDWTDGGTLTALLFLEGSRAYGEVRDDTSRQIVALSGTYGGTQDDVAATFEGVGLVEAVHVDHVRVGPPSAAAAPLLRGP